MDPAIYQQWWPLHLRAARHETLTAEEQAFYVSNLKKLEAEERYPGQEEQLKRLRQEIQEATAQNETLNERRKSLQAEIDALQCLLNNKQPA